MQEKTRAFSSVDLELFPNRLSIGKTDDMLMKFLSTGTPLSFDFRNYSEIISKYIKINKKLIN